MSLKSIEMQVAIPRTMDAGKIQDQLDQRSQNMMAQANEAVQKDTENKRMNVMKNEQTDEARLQKEGHKKEENEKQEQNMARAKTNEKQQKEHHPFKGTIIDYSG